MDISQNVLILIGYLSSICIGLILGLIGGGGSILTIPILVYLMGVEPVVATGYSLFIVGVTSLVGSFSKYKDRSIDLRSVVAFGVPSIVSIFLTRAYLLPNIPDVVVLLDGFAVKKATLLLVLFSMIMVISSFSMIRSKPTVNEAKPGEKRFRYFAIIVQGFGVGILARLVGAGGGFLMIPALVYFASLPMRTAIGTSLFIIAINSLLGFSTDLFHGHPMDWRLLCTITTLSIIGIFIGNRWSRKIEGDKLKKGFGWFVLAMGVFILVKELS